MGQRCRSNPAQPPALQSSPRPAPPQRPSALRSLPLATESSSPAPGGTASRSSPAARSPSSPPSSSSGGACAASTCPPTRPCSTTSTSAWSPPPSSRPGQRPSALRSSPRARLLRSSRSASEFSSPAPGGTAEPVRRQPAHPVHPAHPRAGVHQEEQAQAETPPHRAVPVITYTRLVFSFIIVQ
jgi:hypothetical protein